MGGPVGRVIGHIFYQLPGGGATEFDTLLRRAHGLAIITLAGRVLGGTFTFEADEAAPVKDHIAHFTRHSSIEKGSYKLGHN
jgi:hypothetical protein